MKLIFWWHHSKDRKCGLFLFELVQPVVDYYLECLFHLVRQERLVNKLKPSIFDLCEFGKDVIYNFLL